MKKWKMVSAAVFTASALMLTAPQASSAQEHIPYIFTLPESGIVKEGARGMNVEILQRSLNKAAEANLTVDGVFGPKTTKAVYYYQTAKKELKADGIYGPKTHEALSIEVNTFGLPNTILKLGSRGSDVLKLQQGLNDIGSGLVEDGVYGPKTEGAVLKFQQRFPDLADDGIYGPKTRSTLEKVLND
ncbi:peptidoglycan-binding domain-containing protein [Peribacillus frigoritolerans]|uniref:peptidoglycan-binding domain-containing protein n=1 Tax=Peribacillus frigoritolerans TaxID=450367 RepID=UPI001059F2B3|nr:peptidoglycan-binding protein [Peribacillus frigoritolerans]TDL82710.1 peptidoglycan-binding protein [Peribacillus frigoritolerans]